jgi:hypothetical protein
MRGFAAGSAGNVLPAGSAAMRDSTSAPETGRPANGYRSASASSPPRRPGPGRGARESPARADGTGSESSRRPGSADARPNRRAPSSRPARGLAPRACPRSIPSCQARREESRGRGGVGPAACSIDGDRDPHDRRCAYVAISGWRPKQWRRAVGPHSPAAITSRFGSTETRWCARRSGEAGPSPSRVCAGRRMPWRAPAHACGRPGTAVARTTR